MNHYLSLILFFPLIGALLVLLVPKQNENAIRWIANIFGLLGFLVSIPLGLLIGRFIKAGEGPPREDRR
mgnify:CR=1 FL=1